jgi:hypothetical protein
MAGRYGEDAAQTIERIRAGLVGPELRDDPLPAQNYVTQAVQRHEQYDERDRYDEDYDYYWGGMRMPLWIALILQVPWRQRLDIFVIGFIVGLIIAGIAVLWGLVLAQY